MNVQLIHTAELFLNAYFSRSLYSVILCLLTSPAPRIHVSCFQPHFLFFDSHIYKSILQKIKLMTIAYVNISMLPYETADVVIML